jgi:hypothetical protein
MLFYCLDSVIFLSIDMMLLTENLPRGVDHLIKIVPTQEI